jgi:CubicO group peptidase (beta-lactamase class C family)
VSATATPLHPAPGDIPGTPGIAGTDWNDAIDQGRTLARAALSGQNLPGLSVAVAVRNRIVWTEGFGWADLTERIAVAPDTRFGIGTASTVLTSAAVGLLLERGRLSLDDEVRAHVPAFAPAGGAVTLRQVMGHTAGLRSDGGDEGPLYAVHCERPVEALVHFASRPLLFEPDTAYRFSSYGWIHMSAVVEAASGEPFLRFMRKEVFEPIGMDDTRADSAAETLPSRATSYFPRFAADPRFGPDPMRSVDLSCYAGSSVFLSTPADLVRFALALRGGRLLRAETVAALQAPQRLQSGEVTGYGLGWDLETATIGGQPTAVVGHDGDILGGRVASLQVFPARDLVVAVTSNTSYADTFEVGRQIAEVFAGAATSRSSP